MVMIDQRDDLQNLAVFVESANYMIELKKKPVYEERR